MVYYLKAGIGHFYEQPGNAPLKQLASVWFVPCCVDALIC